MTVIFTSHAFFEKHAAALDRIAAIDGPHGAIERIEVPEGEGDLRVPASELERITVAFFSGDIRNDPVLLRRFWGSVRRAPNLRWTHAQNVGIDDPIFGELIDKGVTVSNSAGSNAEPIAVSAVGAMIALARDFAYWAALQRRHEWRPRRIEEAPDDLSGQTLVVVGLGEIGGRIARLARSLNLHVIGVRRSPASLADGVDEWVPVERLHEVLPRAQWLALAVPLTAQTRNLIDAAALARLPRGARVINVGRGPVIDESALVEALRSTHLGGAYLDVFAEEPLPAESPLWDLPNVMISPHDSGASTGNVGRADLVFLEELERWQRGEQPLRVVTER